MIKALAVLEAGGKLEPFEYDPGPLQDNEVEIDVLYCGVCHSDLSVMENEWGISQYPVVPGHEVVGTVKQVGASVKKLSVGQTVGLGWHAGYCEECSLCDAGDHNMCFTPQPTIMGRHGGFAEQVRASESAVVAIPEGIDLESAGPLFCGGITVFNPLVQFDIKPTDKVAVIGIGGLGHIALKFLNAWGCEVTAFTTSDSKRQQALDLGADFTLNTRDDASLAAHSNRFDLILSTVNVNLDWNLYLETLKRKGRLHLLGALVEPLTISSSPLLGAQRSISGSVVGSPATIKKMLDFANLHDIKPTVEIFPFNKANEAVKHLADGKARYRVVLSRNG